MILGIIFIVLGGIVFASPRFTLYMLRYKKEYGSYVRRIVRIFAVFLIIIGIILI